MGGKYPPLGSLKKLAEENAASLKKESEFYLPKEGFETFKILPTEEYEYDFIKHKIMSAMGLPKDVLIIDPISSPDPKLQESAGKLYEKLKEMVKDFNVPVLFKTQHKDPLKDSKLLIDMETKLDEGMAAMVGVDLGSKNPCGEIVLQMPKPLHYIETQLFVLGSNTPVSVAQQTKEKDVALSKQTQKNGKKKTPKVKKADPIFQWTFKSGQEVMGTRAMYSTLLRSDQTLTCNCPGWIFKKKGETTRFCKHTKQVEEEAKGVFKKWKSGATLPSIEQVETVANIPANKVALTPGIKYGRVIEQD